MSDVEFSRWETPFANGDIEILETHFGGGGSYIAYYQEGLLYEIDTKNTSTHDILNIKLFHKETESTYRIIFEDVGAFRVLDEHGLTELWSDKNSALRNKTNIGANTFRVRNHAWSKESEISFFFYGVDGWSWMIASENLCVEILCENDPKIKLESHIKSRKIPKDSSGKKIEDDEILSSFLNAEKLSKENGEVI